MTAMQVRRWSSEEFAAGREVWQRLLGKSGADPLFMSWDWVSRWWRHHAPSLQAELLVLGVYSAQGELRGIAPLYAHRGIHRGVIATRRIELLGNTWRSSGSVFSEYLDLLADRDWEAGVCMAVAEQLRETAWDEMLLCNLRTDSIAVRLADQLRDAAYLRPPEIMTGWSIALPDSFDAFVSGLDSNTRRKVMHQRQKLGCTLCQVTELSEQQAALERLERWLANRWGVAQVGARARFNAELVATCDPETLRMTELRVGSTCVSVMLNVRVAGTEYYLQSAFDTAYGRGASPGYLHLGHAIEAACRDGIRRFDFLVGRGLNREYKRDFGAIPSELRSVQIVRPRSLRILFGLLDRLRGRE
jgi:CelD/BcsL family acetyltransferase involved in cellulose biosynthesis